MARYSVLLLTSALMSFARLSMAQVNYDFEDGDLSFWGIEGDGSIVIETTNGNPGNSLRVNEPASGPVNYVIAHPAMGGDWSQAATGDSIFVDLYPHEINGTPGTNPLYVLQLRGPGGIAEALSGWSPQLDVWQHVAVALDPAYWTVLSGSWAGLLANVEMVRIRAEYITGDEYVLLDNVGLTFTPAVLVQNALVCSSFEPADGLDGWNFQNTGSIAVSTTEGNPPNAVQISDQGNVLSQAYAPPKFRGDLSAWNGVGELRFDVRINTSLTAVAPPVPHVRLAGPGGEATMGITAPEVTLATNQWHTFGYPLDAGSWTMTAGTWADLLANVITIELTLEYYTGTAETVFLDNFCMGIFPTGVATVATTADVRVLPNPTSYSASLFLPEPGLKRVQVYTTRGDLLFQQSTDQNRSDLDVSRLPVGAYVVRVVSGTGVFTLPLMVAR
ncbi:MAG: T9SS type A sorting domain-containing protein [Flavobacteriales bacterium]|nr:T9SS type A sorting domain-containing protein [Flavobacteriales bacterium]MBP6697108.1 T9SS type A sorting domain-containing protein [Flavobacteriales bacterium]